MDPYQLLGVSRGCASSELKEAFRTLALKLHPDRGGDAAEFVRLREAYQQIAGEIMRKPPPGMAAKAGEQAQRADAFRDQPDLNWEPELVVLDEPLPRIRPARPPDPGWEPELIVRDEPLPRIRPARQRDANWEPELVVSAEANGPDPISPSRAGALPPHHGRDPKFLDRQYIGWVRGVVNHSQIEGSGSREGVSAIVGAAAILSFVVIALGWMFWPSTGERTPTKPSELSAPAPPGGLTPETARIRLPEWPATPPGARKSAPGEPSEPKTQIRELVPPGEEDSKSGAVESVPRM